MKKSLLEIYALIVCLITVVWSLIALGIGSYALIKIAKPEFTIAGYQYEQYLTNDLYRKRSCTSSEQAQLSEEEITKRRSEGLSVAISEEKRAGFQDLTKNIIAFLLNILIFFIHWKLATRSRVHV